MAPPLRIRHDAFLDYVLTTGLAKLDVVRACRTPSTAPEIVTRFYKPLVDALVEPSATFLGSLNDIRKKRLFPPLYGTFFAGAYESVRRGPITVVTANRGVEILVTPELELCTGGAQHVVVLHMGGGLLSQRRVEATCALLSWAFAMPLYDARFGVLDLTTGRLHVSPVPMSAWLSVLQGEAVSFAFQLDHTVAPATEPGEVERLP